MELIRKSLSNNSNHNIKELIAKSKQRDDKAFEQLVIIYQNKVYNLCYQLTGNYNDAQDLSQEVFITAYSFLKGFRNEADLGTWLHRIAVNKWINMQRRNKKRAVIFLDAPVITAKGEIQRELASQDNNPEEILEQKDYYDIVKNALNSLTYEHKAVLVLREVEGYSYEEIAEILGCSVGTIRSRLNRARKSLRDKVELMLKGAREVERG